MFDLKRFYDDAKGCQPADTEGFIQYLRSFRNVIIWGAGYLGTEIGTRLKALDVKVTTYWDARANELESIDAIPVAPSFSQQYPPADTVFIFCITNSFVRDRLRGDLGKAGYDNILIGEHIFQGIVCEASSYSDFNKCRNASACDAYTCDRNESFLPRAFHTPRWKDEERLFFRNVTIVINQKCTLKCKYCYSYTNSYANDLRTNFPTERILRDIDLFFDAVDGVKFVPLIGGETFLHPDLNLIVRKILEKRNFGILNITTNGVVKMHPRVFEGMQDERTQLVFSNYKESLSNEQIDVYDRNVELAKSHGLHVIEPNITPTWSVPTTLSNKHYSLDTMIEKRRACLAPLNCKYLKNGKFFPCTVTDSIFNIKVADYPTDYVELDTASDATDLHQKIRTLLDRKYFQSCGHCDGIAAQTGLAAKAGEQGFFDFINQ